ncbi:hypothetical protein [Nonomuraea soli]|uniref:Uncharacterized protein n=1 Tax=Nonomuraea soli TaxID=1032476 RepID=A0A7W0CV63_9ACTN|nr:hypothetical protein [Nonomuraea soli]MBA2897738.1 hypothetical protein [Nonomuraea soli]
MNHDPIERPPFTPPRVVLVRNVADHAPLPRAIAKVLTLDHGRVVVRPTPGASDTATLALDVLTALGKHPHAARNERAQNQAWQYGAAWLIGARISDLIVDRAHLLHPDRLADLVRLAERTGASLWLLWTGHPPAELEHALAALTQRVVEVRELPYLSYCFDPAEDLPADRATDRSAARPLVGRSIAPTPQASPWPALPSADFTTFLAACRRHLPGHAFTRVAGEFYAVAARAESWMLTHRTLIVSGPAFTAHLAALARDHILGPADDANHALIRLRALQAALFLQGVLLRWDPAALGPEPARRLPGTLTGPIAHRLSTMCRTELAAATALSLHLNHGPTYFEALRCADIDPDAATITTPDHIDDHDMLPTNPKHRHPWPVVRARFLADARRELSLGTTLHLPAAAGWLLAAHLAHRRLQGANADDPFFVHPSQPHRSPAAALTEGIRRTCQTLQLATPPWLHTGDCKFGADRGLVHRTQGWLTERCLTAHLLDPTGLPHVEHPSSYQGPEDY